MLDERQSAVLHGVLDAYLASGLPVGSRALAELRDSPSSATIRHVFATLEDEGYLHQPHTSAGRVPTAKAIRWWLQQLDAPVALASDDSQQLERALREANDETTLWQRASEFLADFTRQVGVIAVQPWRDAGLKQLRFFRLTDRRVLAILVAADGQIRERVGRVPEAYSQAELDAAARYLNQNFAGSTLPRIRRELLRRLEEERAAYDELLKRALVLSHCGVLEMQDSGEVYIQGARHLTSHLGGQQLNEMLGCLSQKERWLRLLTEVGPSSEDTVEWDTGAAGPTPRRWVRVRVGLDLGGPEEIAGCSLVTTNYRDGAVAVLGSTRMEYQRALGAVTLVGELFNRFLGEHSA